MKSAALAGLAAAVLVLGACGDAGNTRASTVDGRQSPSSSDAAEIALASGKPVPLTDPSLPPCGDLLADLGVRDDRLEPQGCTNETHSQYRSRLARYNVSGSEAAAIERFLVNAVKLEKLRFACCGWESLPTSGQIRGADGFLRLVSMTSGESVVNERSRWSEIPTFTVSVELVLDEI